MKVCPKCGTEFPDEWKFCNQCASALAPKQPTAPAGIATPPTPGPPPPLASAAPVSTGPQPSAMPATPELGSLGARALAHLIDLVFLVLAFVLVGNVYGSLFGGLTESGFNLNGVPALVIIGLTLIVFLLYLVGFEGVVGATPGKFILGVRVRGVAGKPCSFGQALVRNILRIVDGLAVYLLGLIVALVTKRKQRVGDLAARTLVVREAHSMVKRASAALFLVACLAGVIFGSIYVRRHPRVPIATFGIANFRFADSESAPPRATAEFKPEDDVRMFYEIPAYQRDSAGYIAVVAHNQILAPEGKPFIKNEDSEVRQKVADESTPVKCNFHFRLPPWAPPGKYTMNIQAEDQIAHKTQSASFAFTVNAPPVETSATLLAKNIEVANSRDGVALNPPAFTAGQSVWLRFRILGMKANDKGQMLLTEDWGISGPDGKALFQKNDDSVLSDQFTYPPPFYPVRLYVDTPSGVEPGQYKFHVVLHDKVGGADFTIDQPFTLNKR